MNIVIFWMCGAMIGSVFAVMLYSVATFNDASSRDGKRGSRSVAGEVMWALVPIFIFIVAALPVVGLVATTR